MYGLCKHINIQEVLSIVIWQHKLILDNLYPNNHELLFKIPYLDIFPYNIKERDKEFIINS